MKNQKCIWETITNLTKVNSTFKNEHHYTEVPRINSGDSSEIVRDSTSTSL